MADGAHAAVPAQLGGYRIERLLARGSSGALYVTAATAADPPRALKAMALPPVPGRRAIQARFLREADLLRRLDHPSIVEVHDAGVDGDVAFVVTTLLPGADLRRYAGPARRLPEPLLLVLGADVAAALAHAHAQGVVHRDVKPANLVFDPASRHVWLTDFGAGRLDDAERTRTGVLVGTPSFMAPEQLAGRPPDASGDVYALAATLFQLLTGRLPHDGATMGALLQSMARGSALDLRRCRPELPDALARLVAQALEREPAARPGAAAFAEHLRSLARDLR
jgi:serine/threonine-protein kinase